MRKNNKNRNVKEKILLLGLILLVIPLVIAANDPGHDQLYIEEEGDSELNGTLNITQNLSVDGGKIKQPGGLTLFGDDSTPSSGPPYISGTSGDELYLDAQASIFFKWYTSGVVYIGSGPGTVTDLNISGALYVQSSTATVGGVNICLENGTNCPGGNNTGNVTSITAASGTPLTTSPTTGDVIINITIPTCGGTDKLTYNGTDFKCETDQDSGGSGDIDSVQTPNIYIYNGSETGDVYLRFNETKLNATIEGRGRYTNISLNYGYNGSEWLGLRTTPSGILKIKVNETNFMRNNGDEVTGNYTFGGVLYIDDTNDRVGIGTSIPSAKLSVNGNISQVTCIIFDNGGKIGNCG